MTLLGIILLSILFNIIVGYPIYSKLHPGEPAKFLVPATLFSLIVSGVLIVVWILISYIMIKGSIGFNEVIDLIKKDED